MDFKNKEIKELVEKIENIRKRICKEIPKVENNKIREFMVIDQVLVNVKDSIKIIENAINTSSWLLQRLLDYMEGKISLDKLEKELANVSLEPSKDFLKEGEYPTVLELLNSLKKKMEKGNKNDR